MQKAEGDKKKACLYVTGTPQYRGIGDNKTGRTGRAPLRAQEGVGHQA